MGMNNAEIIPDVIIPLNLTNCEGTLWFQLDYLGSHEDYKSKPLCVKFQGKFFLRMSHNSDSFKVAYKEVAEKELGKVVKDFRLT
jgi:hypothetical protein